MIVGTVAGLRRALAGAPLSELRLDPVDAATVVSTIETLEEHDAAAVARVAAALRRRVGDLADAPPAFASLPDRGEHPPGMLPVLALLATAEHVVGLHATRGIARDRSLDALADLGQQLRVHRGATGVVGLDTQEWLASIWTGRLLRFGALQVAVQPHATVEPGWVWSVHIPAGAPLDADAVDASLAEASEVLGTAFADHPAQRFHCRSWMLDPWLSEAVPGSRLAQFAERWDPIADEDGLDDVLWFVFGRRPPVPAPASLARRSTLQRAYADRIAVGGRLVVREGVLRPEG